jgi:hypothetical protein
MDLDFKYAIVIVGIVFAVLIAYGVIAITH